MGLPYMPLKCRSFLLKVVGHLLVMEVGKFFCTWLCPRHRSLFILARRKLQAVVAKNILYIPINVHCRMGISNRLPIMQLQAETSCWDHIWLHQPVGFTPVVSVAWNLENTWNWKLTCAFTDARKHFCATCATSRSHAAAISSGICAYISARLCFPVGSVDCGLTMHVISRSTWEFTLGNAHFHAVSVTKSSSVCQALMLTGIPGDMMLDDSCLGIFSQEHGVTFWTHSFSAVM